MEVCAKFIEDIVTLALIVIVMYILILEIRGYL